MGNGLYCRVAKVNRFSPVYGGRSVCLPAVIVKHDCFESRWYYSELAKHRKFHEERSEFTNESLSVKFIDFSSRIRNTKDVELMKEKFRSSVGISAHKMGEIAKDYSNRYRNHIHADL